MRRWIRLSALATLTAAACSPPVPMPSPSDTPLVNDLGETITAQGDVRLFFYRDEPTAGGPSSPTFMVESPDFQFRGEGEWVLFDARAVIYNDDGDNAVLEAARGEFYNDTNRAYMDGGVTLTVGDTQLELESLEWVNEDRLARSDRPLRIRAEGTDLSASAMCYYPEVKELILKNVRGRLTVPQDEAS